MAFGALGTSASSVASVTRALRTASKLTPSPGRSFCARSIADSLIARSSAKDSWVPIDYQETWGRGKPPPPGTWGGAVRSRLLLAGTRRVLGLVSRHETSQTGQQGADGVSHQFPVAVQPGDVVQDHQGDQ